MNRPSTSEIIGLLLATAFVVILVIDWAHAAPAPVPVPAGPLKIVFAPVEEWMRMDLVSDQGAKIPPSGCSEATARGAMAEYDTLAGMLGIPENAPIRTLEKRQYVAAVCLHEELRN
jgi:hypothetical protein